MIEPRISGLVYKITFLVFLLSVIANLCYFFEPSSVDFFNLYSFKNGFNGNYVIGNEYWNLAKNLVDQGVIGNPFGVVTGASSWMPPFYIFLIAGIYSVVGTKISTMFVLIFLKNIALIFAYTSIFISAKKLKFIISQKEYLLLITVFSVCFFHYLFRDLHDTWVVFLLVNLLCVYFIELYKQEDINYRVFGLFGGIILITAPTLIFMWFFLLSYLNRRNIFLCLLLASLFPGLWIVRNFNAFDKFIPIKSNGYFEIAQSNVGNPDGIYQWEDLLNHPYAEFTFREHQGSFLGLEERIHTESKAKFYQYFPNHKMEYLYKCFRRLMAFTFIYSPYFSGYELLPSFLTIGLQFILFLTISVGLSRRDALLNKMFLIYLLGIFPYVSVVYYTRYYLFFFPLILLLLLSSLTLIRINKGNSLKND